jgi:DNA polymerase-3 subunit delta'
MQYPDLAVVQAEQMGETLKVDQIRELQRSLSLAPYEARYRVAILMRFEEANPNASNALLKTLEEPPPQVILMITAESNERLLPTIVSRCEVLRLRPLLPEAVNLGLQHRWDLPPEEAFLLAHISGGRPGYALKLHNEPALLEQRQAWLNEHQDMLAANRVDRFTYAERLAKDKDKLRRALQVWLSLWRDVLLKATGTSTTLSNVDRIEDIEKLSTHLSVQVAKNMVISLERTIKQLNQNVNPRLASEVLLLDLPSIQ